MTNAVGAGQLIGRLAGRWLRLFRISIATIYFGLLGIVFLPVFLVRFQNVKNGTLFCRPWGKVSLWLMGLKLEVENLEAIRSVEGAIMIGNHQDTIDLFTYGSIIPDKSIGIGKKAVRWYPIFGWLFFLSGSLMIDRKNIEKAKVTMERAKEKLLSTGATIFVFPEGTRSRGKGLLPFKKGAFHMAKQLNVPIYPLVSNNYSSEIDLKKIKAGQIKMKLAPIIDEHLRDDISIDELTEIAEKRFQETMKELSSFSSKPVQ